MPIYVLKCSKCGVTTEKILPIGETAYCCETPMRWQPTAPSRIQMCEAGGVKRHTQGYKDDYAKDYRRRMGVES